MLTLIASAATETHQAAQTAGIGAIGLDARALVFQLVNFAILLFLLRLFAYKPILKVLHKRQQTIEESLQNAAMIETAKQQLQQDQQRVLQEARHQAQEIAAQSVERAKGIVAVAEAEASVKAEKIMAQGKAQLAQETVQLKAALQHETLQLVAEATEAIIDLKLDPKRDAALIEQAVHQAKQKGAA